MQIKPLDTLLAIKVLGLGLVPGLKSNDQRVGIVLLEHFNRRSGRCDPGLGRVATLIGISERTVMRANDRLERAGLFRKTRHGGLGNRNSYEPLWAAFQALEAAWRSKLALRANLKLINLSPGTSQTYHLQPDSAVTQTCSTNLHNQTCISGLPKKPPIDRILFTDSKPIGKRSGDAAHDEAERRWTTQLSEQFRSQPVTYGEIIDAITEELREAATRAELRSRGEGLRFVVQQLKLR